jgi:ATP-dependent DNA ligase
MQQCILVQENSSGRVKYIILTQNEDVVDRVWGLIDGKFQETSNTYDYINEGKANQLNPEQAAVSDYNRIIQTKTKEGYIITDSLDNLPDLDDNQMNFDSLPVEFCCSKPNTKIEDKKLNVLIKNDKVKIDRKYNGLCHFVSINSIGNVKIYTRRIDDHTAKYPDLVKSIKKQNFPPNTLLIGELVVDPILNIPHLEGFKLISQISKSNTVKGKLKDDLTKSFDYQKKHKVRYAIFNILFYDDVPVWQKSYGYIVEKYISKFPTVHDNDVIFQPETLNFDSAIETRKRAKEIIDLTEGFVAWDLDQSVEVTFNGKPKRRACYKIKASRDDDVIAYSWKEGAGDHQGQIGSLLIGKFDEDGDFIDLGRVGSGLEDKECDPDNWEFPCVIEIKYDNRFPTGKYQFPRFTKVHEDKFPEDIIVDKNGM